MTSTQTYSAYIKRFCLVCMWKELFCLFARSSVQARGSHCPSLASKWPLFRHVLAQFLLQNIRRNAHFGKNHPSNPRIVLNDPPPPGFFSLNCEDTLCAKLWSKTRVIFTDFVKKKRGFFPVCENMIELLHWWKRKTC